MKGASLIELLVAVALALVISAAGVRALVAAADAFAWQPASAELSARADAVAQLLTADLAAAGAGLHVRPEPGTGAPVAPVSIRLSSWLPPILPRVVGLEGADADDDAATNRLSILTVADGAPQVAVRRLPPRWAFRPGPTCPALVDGCGLRDRMPVLWLEARPGFQLGQADTVDDSGLDVLGMTPAADDALVAGVEIVSYRFDAARGELVRGRAGGRSLPVAGHVAAFAVELWGDGNPPAGPRWPPGDETCVTLADGRPRLAAWAPPGAPSIPFDVARLADGPWCGTAPFRFDADLFRVRRVACAAAARGGHRCRAHPDPGARSSRRLGERAGARGAGRRGGNRRRAAGAARAVVRRAVAGTRRPPGRSEHGAALIGAGPAGRGTGDRRGGRRLVRAPRLADVGGGAQWRRGGGRGAGRPR